MIHIPERHTLGRLTRKSTELARNAQRLSETVTRLSSSRAGLKIHHAVNADEQELLTQARDTQDLAHDLQAALDKLRLDGPKGRKAVIVKSVKNIWAARKIESLDKKLSRRQVILQSMLVINIR